MGNTFQKLFSSDPFPASKTPSFDSHFGFSGERKKRVAPVSEDVLVGARVPLKYRDYCVHLYLEVEKCCKKEFPYFALCKGVLHRYKQCEYDDYVLRMKEYERERRLLLRKQAKENALQAVA
ncbi:NADH dehydrogenase [ubiquinone] 1 beta subcomplex subunit 7, partial [Eufriesea mexicana]